MKDFFQTVNIEKLTTIKDFHRKLSTILKKEVKDFINENRANIIALNDAIKILED